MFDFDFVDEVVLEDEVDGVVDLELEVDVGVVYCCLVYFFG